MPLSAFPKCFLDAMCVDRTMTVDDWIGMTADLDVDGHELYTGFLPLEDDIELTRTLSRGGHELFGDVCQWVLTHRLDLG